MFIRYLVFISLILFLGFVKLFSQFEINYPETKLYCSSDSISFTWSNPENTALDIVLEKYNDDSNIEIERSYLKNHVAFIMKDYSFCNIPVRFAVYSSDTKKLLGTIDSIIIYKSIELTEQSESMMICEGSSHSVFVDADGFNLKYQWFKDGRLLENETSRVLNIQNFSFANAGIYHCIISGENVCNIVQSRNIAMSVAKGPSFTQLPESVMYSRGIDVVFKAKINAVNPKIQWYKDTFEISVKKNRLIKLTDNLRFSGTKTETMKIKNLIYGDRSDYLCIVTDECGSDTARVKIGDNIYFKIIKETGDFSECEGVNVKLRVKVEQYMPGTLEYQWYNPGFKKINESNKFRGTKTRELTIVGVNKKDNNAYYVLVTLKEKGYSLRSEHFYVEPRYKPDIISQPKDYVIKNRENPPTQYGQTYVAVTISNREVCAFRWFRNDTLVRVQWWMFSSNYFLGENMSPRPAKKTDVGKYRCQITNDCGTVWSDTARVIWGLEDVEQCIGTNATLIADDLNTQQKKYDYLWYKKDSLIGNTARISGANTNKLRINEIRISDGGNYDVYAVSGTEKIYLGKVYLVVRTAPKIAKQPPDTIYQNGKYLQSKPISVNVVGRELFYQYYKNGQPYKGVQKKVSDNNYDEYQIFYVGGQENDLPDGTYYVKFWNDCGEITTDNFVVIHEQKPSGSVQNDETTSVAENENIKINLYPNPANEVLVVNYQQFEDEIINVEIFSQIGQKIYEIQVLNTGSSELIINLNNINISNGMYFIKIKNGDKYYIQRFILER